MLFGGAGICSLFFLESTSHTFLKTSESCVISRCVYIYMLSFISYIYNHIYHIYNIYDISYHIYIIFIFTYSSRIYTLDKVGGDLNDGFQRMGTLVHPKTIGPQITNVPLAEVRFEMGKKYRKEYHKKFYVSAFLEDTFLTRMCLQLILL